MIDETFMRRCIALAQNGRYHAAPNPMVGCCIVSGGRIIGEGFHARCGEPHAEVNAIRSVRSADRERLKESTLYVSLEPCAHFGRTPPCAQLILQSGIPRVVVGCTDPFSKVSGRGIAMLREGGVEVVTGVLEEECRRLNRQFMTAQTLHRPFITLKWAVSADGFLDRWRTESDEAPAHLSNPRSQMRVHKLRASHGAILVGHATLRLDCPSLTVRAWCGESPQPVVLGRVEEGELPQGFQAFDDIDVMLSTLHAGGCRSLLVEGGSQTLQSFIDQGLWDAAHVEVSDCVLGSGVPAPRMPAGVCMKVEQALGAHFLHYENL